MRNAMLWCYSVSWVNWIAGFMELIWSRTWVTLFIGIIARTSSTYRFQKVNWTGQVAKIYFSIDCIVISARTTEIGEPMCSLDLLINSVIPLDTIASTQTFRSFIMLSIFNEVFSLNFELFIANSSTLSKASC